MPQKVLKFTGINRMVNEYQNSGACEELINLRPEAGGYSVIKNKKTVKSNISYSSYYIHSFGAKNNTIYVDNGVVYTLSSKGPISITKTFEQKKGVSVTFAGNVMLVYCEETSSQEAFKYEGESYKPNDIDIKQIRYTYFNYGNKVSVSVTPDNTSIETINNSLREAVTKFYSENKSGLCGMAVVGCTYELESGQEIWSTAFTVANQAEHPFVGSSSITVSGASSVSVTLNFDESELVGVKKVNIYATRPVFPYRVENGPTGAVSVRDREEDVNLDGQLMYFQGSVTPKTKNTFSLNFGYNQPVDRIMDVTQGCIERVGKTVSYNNRFHYYQSSVTHILQTPTVSKAEQNESIASEHWWAPLAKIEGEWYPINVKCKFDITNKLDFVYPMANVKELAFVRGRTSGGEDNLEYEYTFFVELNDSSAYNYSYAFDVEVNTESADALYLTLERKGRLWGQWTETKVPWKSETNVLNVSDHLNPFVFPINYSYNFGGEIEDIATAYLPISSTQAGQYPLTVFTSNGIYALEQGSGSVLYSNIVPLQPNVIDGKAAATPHGTFFVSSKNLYVLDGREAISVSSSLNGDRELNIRDTKAYKSLCCGEGGSKIYDFSGVLSKEDFEKYIVDSRLTYDQLQNELIISSIKEDVDYSYVLNINTKQFHKVGRKYVQSISGARYVLETKDGVTNVVDLHEEVEGEQPILLQSRPFSLEMLYTHIQRLQMFVDAKLGEGQNLCLSVFGSDNLYDWKCIISAQKHDTVLRQITTNRAAKSYKDYVILINGTVSTDTDLSEIIADYTVVSRRIG